MTPADRILATIERIGHATVSYAIAIACWSIVLFVAIGANP